MKSILLSSSSSLLSTTTTTTIIRKLLLFKNYVFFIIVSSNIYMFIQSTIYSNCSPFQVVGRSKTKKGLHISSSSSSNNKNINTKDDDDIMNNYKMDTTNDDDNDDKHEKLFDNDSTSNNNNKKKDDDYTDKDIALLLSLYDWNTIQYISGIIEYDTRYDTIVYNQCLNQTGYEITAEPFLDYCAYHILNPVRCCYCYYNIFPTFIYEEINNNHRSISTNLNLTTTNKYQRNWKKQLHFLNLPNNQSIITTTVLDTNNNTITDNSYRNTHDPDRPSYYFCMAPRKYSIPVKHMNSTILRTKKILNADQKLILVTGKYAYNNKFQDEMIESCNEIEQQHLFDAIHCHYDDEIFFKNNETLKIRFARHRQYLINETDDTTRGGGYWFHKAISIRYYMNIYKDNDYIFYSDQDYLNRIEALSLYKMVEVMETRNADIILELLGGIEKDWTKADILVAFNATDAIRNSYQVWGGIMFIRNNALMRNFFDALIDCNANYHMISDEPSIQPNYDGYEDNRHDQSILSLFYKTFLSNQSVIGPPVQPYFELNRYTFQLYNTTKVYCPF